MLINNIKYFLAVIIGGLVVWGSLKFFGHSDQTKSGFVLTQNLFQEFEGTKEFKAKMQPITEKQQSALDSLSKEIILAGRTPRAQELTRVYQELKSSYLEKNRQEELLFSENAWKQLNQYIEEYGKEKGYGFVFGATGNGGIMYAEKSLDLTGDVIKYVNRKYKGE